MTESTIQELIDEIQIKAENYMLNIIRCPGQETNDHSESAGALINARDSLLFRITQLQREAEEFEQIVKWIKSQPGCPEDAQIKLVIPNLPNDKRLWFDVISEQLSQESYEPDTNSSDPCWHSFELVTTNEKYLMQQGADDWKASYTRALKDSDDFYAAKTLLLERAEKAEAENKKFREAMEKIKESAIALAVMNISLANSSDMPEKSVKNFYSEIKRTTNIILDLSRILD